MLMTTDGQTDYFTPCCACMRGKNDSRYFSGYWSINGACHYNNNFYSCKHSIGDHISVPGEKCNCNNKVYLYRHHMIVVKVLGSKKLRVIHFSSSDGSRAKAVIHLQEDYKLIPRSCVIYRIDHDPRDSYCGEEAIERAMSKIGEDRYHFLFNNCECFCTWVKVNKNRSSQAEKGMAVAGAGAVAVGVVGTIAIFTIAILGAVANANKKSSR